MNCNGAGACGYLSGKQGCSTCQTCSGGSFACSLVGAGTDPNNECPGAFGTCADVNCNGAGACGYLAAGQQGCGTCNYCTGSAFGCSVVGAGTDPYNACTASYNGCSSICVKTGPDGNCNGASACNAGGGSANVAANYYCSGGSEVSGTCNAVWACSNALNTNGAYNNAASPYWTQAYCTGAGACTRTGAEGNGDDSSAACTCDRGASGYWAIGGETDAAGCCGDDSGENKRTRVCSSGCTTSAADDGCCDSSSDCLYSSTCYASGATYSTLQCQVGSWRTTSTTSATTTIPATCYDGTKNGAETLADVNGGCPYTAQCQYSSTCGGLLCCKKISHTYGVCCNGGSCNVNLGVPYC